MRSLDEWHAEHDDQAVPPRVKLRIFSEHGGFCPICTRALRPGQWDIDHIIALGIGGQHREGNLQPVCRTPCHSDKTKADRRAKAKSDRSRKRSAGIAKPRTMTRWRRFDGSPVIADRDRKS
jgi:5-methylcytosine-specific restriction protein A